MGKRIITRARGKGGPPYKSPGHRFAGRIGYPSENAVVKDIVHDPARDAPLALLETESKKEILVVAANGQAVGERIVTGGEAYNGNIIPISKIPKGAFVFAIETHPGSGPKLCCSPGTKAIVIAHEHGRTTVQMPSGQFKNFLPACRATVGVPAGGGQREKRMINAGQAFHAHKARNKLYPRTSASSMNAVDHPFGGQTNPGGPKTRSRNAPPGAKVGSISARRTGRRKK